MTVPSLSVADVAARVGLSAKAIRSAIGRGDLVAYKVGGRLRIDPADLETWLQSCRVTQPAPRPRRPSSVRSTHRRVLRTLLEPDQGGDAR